MVVVSGVQAVSATDPTKPAPDPIVVGIEYAHDWYARNVRPISLRGLARHVKATDWLWQELEALPGLSRPGYNWKPFDDEVDAWRAAGFEVGAVLRCKHWLATAPTWTPPAPLLASAPPKNAAMWASWERLAFNVADHFRGRVAWYEIESEPDRLVAGKLDEVLRIHKVAAAAIRAADPAARIVLGGLGPGDFLDDAPSAQALAARIAALTEPRRSYASRAFDLYGRMLAELDCDVAELHSLHGVGGVAAGLEWMRSKAPAGCELWVGDAFPAASLEWSSYVTLPASRKPEMDGRLLALERGDPAAWAELDAEKVETTHARILEADRAGAARIYFGGLVDWPRGSSQAFQGILQPDGTPRPVCEVIRAAQGVALAA